MPRRSTSASRGQTVLVIDDQEDSIVSVRRLLEREGFRVLTAPSGSAALDLLKDHEVQVIVAGHTDPMLGGEFGAAGIAHEVNTPLGAVMNSLEVLADLGREYADSVCDPTVRADDHAEIAAEIQRTAEAAKTWARKAAAIINGVRPHGREPAAEPPQAVAPRAVVGEVQALLAHRLHASACTLEFDDETRGATIVGDPSRLGQVLLNLVSNAIDAYEDARVLDGRIEIRASCTTTAVLVTVRDWAGGIPPSVLPHVFDELFTTKEPGRGTGLGLWIARNLVEQSFAGTLTVESEVEVGSVFTLTLPLGPATTDSLATVALRA